MYESFMRRAIALSCQGVETGGGPFGAVVVKDGEVIGEGMNQVVPHADPTAHAACAKLGTHDLAGAVIVSSCEPCPMCLGAIWWSRIGLVVYGNGRADAAAIGFDDAAIYAEVAAPIEARRLPLRRVMAEEALSAFQLWQAKPDKVPY